MAKMIPSFSEVQLDNVPSSAERTFYAWCREWLPQAVTVYHSVRWTYKDNGRLRDGEADFVICDEHHGVLVVEVKGGGVTFDPRDGVWRTRDKNGISHSLKRSPFAQAKDSKYTLLKYLDGSPAWRRTFGNDYPPFGHAAFFPDLDRTEQFIGIDSPLEIVGGRSNGGDRLRKWLQLALSVQRGSHSLGVAGLAALEAALAPSIEVMPLRSAALEDAEVQRIRLSSEQNAVLSSLSRHVRAAITGGAGTGKTLLAMEKVRRLASDGKKTLLLCYNRPLATMLADSLETTPDAGAQTFHEFCGQMINKVVKLTGRNLRDEVLFDHPDWHLYDQVLPEALARAAEIVEDRFDAIIVDEGQDFRSSFWFPIELFLKDEKRSTFYVFFDENQRLYDKLDSLPIDAVPYLLTRNCRNATVIHDLAYEYYTGDLISSSTLAGEVISIGATGLAQGARSIAKIIRDLLMKDAVKASQICVLVAGSPKLDYFDALEEQALPNSFSWCTIENGFPLAKTSGILIATVQQFKGLESDVVFVWGADSAVEADRAELAYVGFSRAKTHLYVVDSQGSTSQQRP